MRCVARPEDIRESLKTRLAVGEKVLGDSGYRDENCIVKNNLISEQKRVVSILLSQHENVSQKSSDIYCLNMVHVL